MLKYLNDIKEKLVTVDKTLNEQSEVKTKDQRENKLDNLLKDLLDNSPDNAIVYINVGGTKFATRKKTLLNVEDNLFYKIIKSNKLDNL